MIIIIIIIIIIQKYQTIQKVKTHDQCFCNPQGEFSQAAEISSANDGLYTLTALTSGDLVG